MIYDKYIVSFSGGKDSTACFLNLLDIGIPTRKIELWHQDIDGQNETFMDWEVTPAYCKAFAKAFNVPIYFQWKEGGFKRELLRNDTNTAPITFELENGSTMTIGGKGPDNTRRKFPQVSADLSVRWCSAYLKIDVCASAGRNQTRFNKIKTVILSGERGEESTARAKYEVLERDRADLREGKKFIRYVDRWRPVKNWTEKQIWEIIEKYKVRVHPCYYLGWGRCSCKFCIFGNKNQIASAFAISPEQGKIISNLEKEFGFTIKRNIDFETLASKGVPYQETKDEIMVKIATSKKYYPTIFMKNWYLPSGAYGDSCGPT